MRFLFLLVIAIASTTSSFAVGVKLYVGSSYNSTHMNNHYLMELIVCNNTLDTIFIKREDLDNLYPSITDDAAVIVDGGSRFFVTNTTEMIGPDPAKLFDIDPDGTNEDRDEVMAKRTERRKENDALKQRKINNHVYYILAPQKCITVNSYSQTGRQELSKLWGIKEENKEQIKVYYTVPVWMCSSKDYVQRRELLISRESKALKKCLFYKK